MRLHSASIAIAFSVGLASTPAMAQKSESRDVPADDEIVVTASNREQRLIDAPASITVITSELLAKRPNADLTDALRDAEGINITGNSNTRDIYIRGMPGDYTLLMVDGIRQSTRDSRTNGTGGYEQRFTPPVAAIDRIEVVRGPMSTLYGSDAIGGVINIITRKIPEKWEGSLGADYVVQEHNKSGNWWQGQYYLSGPVIGDTLGVQTWGRIYRRTEDKIVSGNYGARDYNLTGRIAWKPAPGQEVLLEGNTTRVKKEASAGKTLASTGTSNHNVTRRTAGAIRWNGDWNWATSKLSVMREASHYRSWTDDGDGTYTQATRNPKITNTVADALFTVPLAGTPIGDHTLSFGGQYIWNRLVDINPGLRDTVQRTYTIWQRALFIEDEWRITRQFALTGGIRWDDHQVYGGHWSPRLYAVWDATPSLTIKGGVSTGFRAPDVREIAPGYASTTGGSSCTYGADGTCGVIIGDPDLKAETSTNYEFNVLYHPSANLSLGGTAFHTTFRNKIESGIVYEDDGTAARWEEDTNYILYYNYNVGKSRTQGFEFTARWKPLSNLSLKAGYTYTDSKQLTGDYKGFPLTQTPKHMANARADLDLSNRLSLWTSLAYRGKEVNAALRSGSNGKVLYNADGDAIGRVYPEYFQADIGGSFLLRDAVTLKLGIYNLFDKKLDVADYNWQGDGRRIWMGINARF